MTKLGEEMGKDIVAQRTDVVGTVIALTNLQESKKLLNSGIITGTGAGWLTSTGSFLSEHLGFTAFDDPVSNTQAYAASMGVQVGRIIKQFGAGTGLSDADREYAEKIVAGKITLNKKAIIKLIGINERGMKSVIKNYNEIAEQVMKKPDAKSLPYDLRVKMPDFKNAPDGGPGASTEQTNPLPDVPRGAIQNEIARRKRLRQWQN